MYGDEFLLVNAQPLLLACALQEPTMELAQEMGEEPITGPEAGHLLAKGCHWLEFGVKRRLVTHELGVLQMAKRAIYPFTQTSISHL